jgi:hypothetical protein
MFTKFWCVNLLGRGLFGGRLRRRDEVNTEISLGEWLRIGSGGGICFYRR